MEARQVINPTLERAARASFESHAWGDVGPDEKPHTWESLTEDWRDVYRKGARAVLMAVLPDGDKSISDIVVCDYIRAILAEGE